METALQSKFDANAPHAVGKVVSRKNTIKFVMRVFLSINSPEAKNNSQQLSPVQTIVDC